MLWGIRTGLLIFLAGSLEGIVMSVHGAHAVGTPDGGPGLPVVDWSTVAGDLRIAHFFGIHALQAMPIIGLLIDARGRRHRWPSTTRCVLTCLAALGYATALVFLFTQAMRGESLFAFLATIRVP